MPFRKVVGVVGRYSRFTEQIKRTERLVRLAHKSAPNRPYQPEPVRYKASQRLSSEALDQLVADYRSGVSSRKLAVQYGLTRSAVIELLRDRGVEIRYPRVTPAEAERIGELYRGGMRQIDIADKFGRSKGAIWHLLERMGEL